MPTTTVTCTTDSCPNQSRGIEVPADGEPVTCGGCGTVLTNSA